MKFSLISDMHLDFPQPKIPYDLFEEHVVVAGDTTNGLEGLKFLQKLKNKGHTVYAVDGNHEHYRNRSQNRSVEETRFSFGKEHPSYHEGKIPVVLTNGWYPVTKEALWRYYMNDSYNCVISQDLVNQLAKEDYDFLYLTLLGWKGDDRRGIVVTHTAPCAETLNPIYANHYSNEWYWNPLMETLLKEFPEQIAVWCHGHTHESADKIVHGVRVVCNPRGYPGENPGWKPITIEV